MSTSAAWPRAQHPDRPFRCPSCESKEMSLYRNHISRCKKCGFKCGPKDERYDVGLYLWRKAQNALDADGRVDYEKEPWDRLLWLIKQ